MVETQTLARLLNADRLTCTFTQGTAAEWRAGVPTLAPVGDRGAAIVFDQIDPVNYRARLAGGFGAAAEEILLLRTQIGLTFVEENEAGGIHVTTVYGAGPRSSLEGSRQGSSAFIAVHSRHFVQSGGAAAAPAPAQYHGLCRAGP